MVFKFDDELSSNDRSVKDVSNSEDNIPCLAFDQITLGSRSQPVSTHSIRPLSHENTTLRGIVFKMDHLAERALVRIMIEQDHCQSTFLTSGAYVPIDIDHLYIPFKSIGVGENNIEMGSIIEILEYQGVFLLTNIDDAILFNEESSAEIIKYKVDFTMNIDRKQNELVALTKVHDNYINVVGGAYMSSEGIVGFSRNNRFFDWNALNKHSFLYGDLIYLPEFYKVVLNDGTPEVVYDHDARIKSIDFNEKTGVDRSLWREQPLLTNIRKLTKNEANTISLQTRNLASINLELAVQYVLDPLITCASLEEFVAREAEKDFTVQVSDLIFDIQKRFTPHRYVIYAPMTESIQNCLNKPGRETWHLESQLVLSTDMFGGNNIPVVVERTNWDLNGAKYIRLSSRSGYEPVLESLNKHPERTNWSKMNFQLGPKSLDSNRNYKTILADFTNLYNQRFSLFEAFIGRDYDRSESEVDYHLTGDTLDESQELALKTALQVKGFTCISAPPGSGKTFLISQIIAAKLQSQPTARFAVCGATNMAVTNAVEAVQTKLLGGKFIRQFSPKAEAETEKNSPILEICLRRMIEDEKFLGPLMQHRQISDAVKTRDEAKKIMEQKTSKVKEQLRAVADFKRAESILGIVFVRYYAPSVFGSTASIMAGVTHEEISHLIIDEASQLSQVDALLLYCRLTHLQSITLVGDTRQLGPFTNINKGSLAYEIMNKGELNCLEKLRSAKVELQYIYRSHPRIVDLLLKPIYGNHLRSGVTSDDRKMAEVMNLPCAQDGSPVLFVQVEGVEKNGRNLREAEVVLDFLDELSQKGVKPDDVSIVCHHKAQKDNLSQVLKDRGIVGPLNLKYSVNTVDAYQGKEAKIVLLLTTKTCESRNYESLRRTFSFISNPQRETVAVSRAQHAVYLFGNWRQLSKMSFWKKFGQGIEHSGAIVNEHWLPINNVWNTEVGASNNRRRGWFN